MRTLLLSISLAVAVNTAFLLALSGFGTPPKRAASISAPVIEIISTPKNQTRAARAPRASATPTFSAPVMRKQTPLRPGLSLSAKRPQSQARSGAVASPLPRIDLKPDQFGTWPLADIILPETPVEQTLLAVSGNQNEFRPEEVQAQPVKLRHVQPEYPRWALQQGLEGTVSLIFLIDETGKTTNIQVTRNSEFPEFDFASIRAVKQWRYKPATREGRPIAVWQPCIVRFQLNE